MSVRLYFIRCSDRCYQAFCPQHVHEDNDDPSLFWDVVDGSLYCTACDFTGTLDVLSMSGHLTPPEFFSLRLEIHAVAHTEEEE